MLIRGIVTYTFTYVKYSIIVQVVPGPVGTRLSKGKQPFSCEASFVIALAVPQAGGFGVTHHKK